MEQAGATVAINDLLVSVHGHGENASMVLFPGGWPAGEAVSFERIRVKGTHYIYITHIYIHIHIYAKRVVGPLLMAIK